MDNFSNLFLDISNFLLLAQNIHPGLMKKSTYLDVEGDIDNVNGSLDYFLNRFRNHLEKSLIECTQLKSEIIDFRKKFYSEPDDANWRSHQIVKPESKFIRPFLLPNEKIVRPFGGRNEVTVSEEHDRSLKELIIAYYHFIENVSWMEKDIIYFLEANQKYLGSKYSFTNEIIETQNTDKMFRELNYLDQFGLNLFFGQTLKRLDILNNILSKISNILANFDIEFVSQNQDSEFTDAKNFYVQIFEQLAQLSYHISLFFNELNMKKENGICRRLTWQLKQALVELAKPSQEERVEAIELMDEEDREDPIEIEKMMTGKYF